MTNNKEAFIKQLFENGLITEEQAEFCGDEKIAEIISKHTELKENDVFIAFKMDYLNARIEYIHYFGNYPYFEVGVGKINATLDDVWAIEWIVPNRYFVEKGENFKYELRLF